MQSLWRRGGGNEPLPNPSQDNPPAIYGFVISPVVYNPQVCSANPEKWPFPKATFTLSTKAFVVLGFSKLDAPSENIFFRDTIGEMLQGSQQITIDTSVWDGSSGGSTVEGSLLAVIFASKDSSYMICSRQSNYFGIDRTPPLVSETMYWLGDYASSKNPMRIDLRANEDFGVEYEILDTSGNPFIVDSAGGNTLAGLKEPLSEYVLVVDTIDLAPFAERNYIFFKVKVTPFDKVGNRCAPLISNRRFFVAEHPKARISLWADDTLDKQNDPHDAITFDAYLENNRYLDGDKDSRLIHTLFYAAILDVSDDTVYSFGQYSFGDSVRYSWTGETMQEGVTAAPGTYRIFGSFTNAQSKTRETVDTVAYVLDASIN